MILNRGLGGTLDAVRESLAIDSDGRVTETLPAEVRAGFDDELFFTVSDRHGRAFLSVPAGRARSYHPFEPDIGEKPQYFEHSYLHSGESYLGVTARVVLDKQEFRIQLVEEVPHWQNFLHYSMRIFLSGAGIIIILHFSGSALLAWTTLKASFEPVEEAARQARRIVPGKRGIRIKAAGLPGEVVPLAEAVNSALDRLERAFAAQKRFTADAAHELLTPLAIMKADIDAIPDPGIARTLSEDIDQMVELVTRLLELSEIESEERMPDDILDLREVAREVMMRPRRWRYGKASRPRSPRPTSRYWSAAAPVRCRPRWATW